MASIDSYPVDFAIPRNVPKPRTSEPKRPDAKIPHLTPKERYLLEWLASQVGKSSIGKLPSKAGILAMVRLATKGLIRVPIEMSPQGWDAVVAVTRKEQISSDRVARKIQIRKHEARLVRRS